MFLFEKTSYNYSRFFHRTYPNKNVYKRGFCNFDFRLFLWTFIWNKFSKIFQEDEPAGNILVTFGVQVNSEFYFKLCKQFHNYFFKCLYRRRQLSFFLFCDKKVGRGPNIKNINFENDMERININVKKFILEYKGKNVETLTTFLPCTKIIKQRQK